MENGSQILVVYKKKTLYVFGVGIGVKEGALRPTPNTYRILCLVFAS
jgi:hypothetical protein